LQGDRDRSATGAKELTMKRKLLVLFIVLAIAMASMAVFVACGGAETETERFNRVFQHFYDNNDWNSEAVDNPPSGVQQAWMFSRENPTAVISAFLFPTATEATNYRNALIATNTPGFSAHSAGQVVLFTTENAMQHLRDVFNNVSSPANIGVGLSVEAMEGNWTLVSYMIGATDMTALANVQAINISANGNFTGTGLLGLQLEGTVSLGASNRLNMQSGDAGVDTFFNTTHDYRVRMEGEQMIWNWYLNGVRQSTLFTFSRV